MRVSDNFVPPNHFNVSKGDVRFGHRHDHPDFYMSIALGVADCSRVWTCRPSIKGSCLNFIPLAAILFRQLAQVVTHRRKHHRARELRRVL